MKKTSTLLLALAVAAIAMASVAAIADDEPVAPVQEQTHAFVDADGDGICDNHTGERKGLGLGTRANFVDADGDGVCDNIGSRAGQRFRDGSGNRYGGGTCNGTFDGTAQGRRGSRNGGGRGQGRGRK